MQELVTAERPYQDAAGDPYVDDAAIARAISVIDTVVRRRCRNWRIADDLPADVRGEVLLRLLTRLRDPESAPISGLDEYVAGITSRVIDDLIRAASPEWARLKHRIRYALNHDDRFVVSMFGDGRIVCSLRPATPFGRQRVRTRAADALARAMLDVLRQGERERTIDEMVNEIAARTGVVDPIRINSESIAAARAVDPDVPVESTQSLRALWREILELPRRQRLALLLNARDPAGDSVLRLLIAEGIVTSQELALAVEVRESDLEPLMGRLPMMDVVIAEWLQVTRQQVINLRSAARDRLARRMARTR